MLNLFSWGPDDLCRQAVRAELISAGVLDNDAYVVIAGPANTYAHYVATLEEYSVQRYEGASTIFGQCKVFLTARIPRCLIIVFLNQIPLMPTSINILVSYPSWRIQLLVPRHRTQPLPNKLPLPFLFRYHSISSNNEKVSDTSF